jgi:hypothetical protein
MPFQSAHERFLRDRIAESEQQLSELDSRRKDADERLAEAQAQHAAAIAELDRIGETASAVATALRQTLGNFLESRPTVPKAKRRAGQRRVRGPSEYWQRMYNMLPMAPDPGIRSVEFVALVRQEKPDMTEGAIRSQLTAGKKAGRLENPGSRWRRLAVRANEEIEASDDTSIPHRPPEASNGAAAWAAAGTD